MKRTTETDGQWDAALCDRKRKAEREMRIADHKNGFVTLAEIMSAARKWGCSENAAENRLMRGELPD